MKTQVKCAADSGANFPEYKTIGASGADIRAFLPDGEVKIARFSRALIPTGLRFEIPEGFEIQVRSRSGLAAKNGVVVLNSPGTIDSDYRGEIKVILANFGEEDFVVKNGERIAQIVLARTEKADFVRADFLEESERGSGGFGSTGRN